MKSNAGTASGRAGEHPAKAQSVASARAVLPTHPVNLFTTFVTTVSTSEQDHETTNRETCFAYGHAASEADTEDASLNVDLTPSSSLPFRKTLAILPLVEAIR